MCSEEVQGRSDGKEEIDRFAIVAVGGRRSVEGEVVTFLLSLSLLLSNARGSSAKNVEQTESLGCTECEVGGRRDFVYKRD